MKLLPKNKEKILKLFFDHPEQQFYMQEIGRRLGNKAGVFQRMLNDLEEDGILLSEFKANARFFRVNKNHPIYSELKSIISKSVKICLAICFMCASFSFSEEEPLSLRVAILKAFKNNKDIQMQEKNVASARANIMDARSRFLPHINLDASYTHNDKVFLNNIFTGYNDDNQLGLSLTESLYNGGANFANFRQAQLGLKVQEETLRAKKLDVEFEAKRLYYGLLLAHETQRIARELVEQAKEHYQNVEDRFKHGTASRFDALQSKVQVSLLMPQVVEARNDIEYIKAELNKLLGQNVNTEIDTREKLGYKPIEIQEGEFLKVSYLNKPELILKALGVDINKWGVQMAKSGYRPDINILAGYNYRSNSARNIFSGSQKNWKAGLAVTVPIFEGFSTKAKVDAAKAEYAQAAIDKDNLAEQIAVDVRKGCLDLKEAQAIIDSQRDNIMEAREALRIAQVSYDNGVAINLDVFDAQVSLAQIQKNLAQGIFDYLLAQASLERNMAKSYITEVEYEDKTKQK